MKMKWLRVLWTFVTDWKQGDRRCEWCVFHDRRDEITCRCWYESRDSPTHARFKVMNRQDYCRKFKPKEETEGMKGDRNEQQNADV